MAPRVIALALLVILTGCAGPQFLKVQRYKYNEAIQQSTAQQLLLNIVRMRYNDSPMFLNVGDIDARFTLESSATASGTINENVGADPLNANLATVSATSKFANNPNIKLRPMQDADFGRLLEPLTFDEMFALATRRQFLYEYLALAMQSYTYKEMPADKETTVDAYRDTWAWKTFLEELQKYDKNGRILIRSTMEETEELLPQFAASEIAPKDVIKAKLAGLTFKKKKHEDEKDDDGKHEDEYVLVGAVRKWTITLPLVTSGKAKRYQFMEHKVVESRDKDTELVKARFRSIVQMMYCLSLGVNVPPTHEPEGNGAADQPRILGFQVGCRALPPSDAFVRVKYRGYWFYIKRTDKDSKKFFSVLTEFFVERAGKPATTTTTLPL